MPDVPTVTQPSPMLRMPHICLAEDLDSTLPLEHTAVSVQIIGPVAAVVVTQRFGNPLKAPAELDYRFPLPENSAISGFELKIGSRTIMGDLQEREAARTAYEDARGQGKRAGLFEQQRPNLFALRLANVQAGETVHATLRYQQRLKFQENVLEAGGGYEFIFPMGLTPKYDSPEHPDEGKDVHAPVAKADEKIGPVEISLAVDAGLRAGEPVSPSHAIETTRVDERRFQVRLAGEQLPDHDFVLRWPVTGAQARAAGWCSGEPVQAFFMATLLPPQMDNAESDGVQPREFIFVLDRSGSMSGQPILQARNALRACLRTLNPEDTFRILLFDNQLEWFQKESVPVTQAQVDRADAYLDKVQGRGGTEIVKALEAALGLPIDHQRTRFVVFLTDGAVSAEERVLEGVRSKIGAARLFTFGIGPSVNRALLSRMAGLGRGRAEFLQLNEDIEGAIIRFQDSVSFPALTDLSLEWAHGKAWDVYPARLPDLYYGQPLEICGRVARSGKTPVRLMVKGKRAGQPVTLQLDLPEPVNEDPALRWIWAQARLGDLQEQQGLDMGRAEKLRAEMLGLALEYNLVTAYTSFVAVDQEQGVSGTQPRVIHVAQPLPEGLDPGGFNTMGGAMPGQPRQVMQAMAAFPATFFSAPPPAAAPSARMKASIRDSIPEQAERAVTLPGRAEALPPAGGEAHLRELARTQNINGSWGDDVEQTAVALLAFVRAGQTPRAGSYRQALRRAIRWLVDHPGQSVARFIRARALSELAEATQDDSDRQAAEMARQGLPEPVSLVERAALGQAATGSDAIHSLDDLRVAGLLKVNLPAPKDLLKDKKQSALIRAWMALL